MSKLMTSELARLHEEIDPVVLGRNIRSARRARELTQADLADAAGVSTAYLSRIEDGQRRPSARVLATVARRMRVPVTELLESTVTPEPSEPLDVRLAAIMREVAAVGSRRRRLELGLIIMERLPSVLT